MCAVSVCDVHNRAIDEANRFMCGVGIHGSHVSLLMCTARAYVFRCTNWMLFYSHSNPFAGIAEVRCREQTHTRYLETCTSCSHTATIILHSVNGIIFSTPVYWFFSLRMGKSTWKKPNWCTEQNSIKHTHTYIGIRRSNEMKRTVKMFVAAADAVASATIQNAELRHQYYYLQHHTLYFFTRSISRVLRFNGIWVLCERTDAQTILRLLCAM